MKIYTPFSHTPRSASGIQFEPMENPQMIQKVENDNYKYKTWFTTFVIYCTNKPWQTDAHNETGKWPERRWKLPHSLAPTKNQDGMRPVKSTEAKLEGNVISLGNINRFRERHHVLCYFYPCNIWVLERVFASSEHAYQFMNARVKGKRVWLKTSS